MQRVVARFTKSDLAKYPFLTQTVEYVKQLGFSIEDVMNPELDRVFKRAENRLEEAILYAVVTTEAKNPEIEILSFPVASMLAAATDNAFIKKRYALAEAKRTFEEMKPEPKDRILAIGGNFGWRLAVNTDSGVPLQFKLNFADYLRNTTQLRDSKWKLVNRLMASGDVYLTGSETARLLSEEVRRYIERRLDVKDLPRLPEKIIAASERIKQLCQEKIGQSAIEGFPKAIVNEAFPPCITGLYEAFSSGRHLSHIGRFTLTSFLINIGMTSDKLIELFKNFSDYDERMTRYQVEHIAGEKGSRTRYTPPRCETLRTHGVCTEPDSWCRAVRHPLSYYRRKASKRS